jgi:hypothetical protein
MGESVRPSGMRRSALLPLVLAALAACSYQPFIGGDPSVLPSVSPDEPVGTEPVSPGPQPSGDGSVRETPNPDVVHAHQTAVDHYAIGPDGRTVVVYYWGGTQACFGLQKVDVSSDLDGATVMTVFEGTLPDAAGDACTMEALLKSTVVTLESPIVVDAAQPDAPAGEPQLAVDAEEVDIEVGVENPIPVAVTGYQLSGDGATLTVHFYGGVPECYGVASASVDTSERPWTVSLSEGHIAGAEVCIEIALAKAFAFTPDSQLIRDGSLTG